MLAQEFQSILDININYILSPNFLIFVPRGFPWRILRLRGGGAFDAPASCHCVTSHLV